MQTYRKISLLPIVFFLLFTTTVRAQVSVYDQEYRGSVYVAIGSNTPSYSSSTIHITQSALGSDYDLHNVNADDQNNKSGSILNNSFRIGYFFNYNQDFAVELNYDPVNYHITDMQNIPMSGKYENATVNNTLTFAASSGYYYYLNGSNLILVNIVKRFGIYQDKMHYFYLDGLAKLGAGPVMPAASNSFHGKTSENSSFQLGGWNAGLEAALRVTIYRYVFLEAAWKYDMASYTKINVYNGTASQSLTTTAMIFSAGFTFKTSKRNPRFEKVKKARPVLTIGSMNTGNED